jgi:hypothetical protein
MMEISRRHELTFEQAEGLAPLPSQLAIGELSPSTIAGLWAIVDDLLNRSKRHDSVYSIGSTLSAVLKEYFVKFEHRFADEFSQSREQLKSHYKQVFVSKNYGKILGFLQFLIRSGFEAPQLADRVNGVLEENLCAYRVFEGRTIAPIASREEGIALDLALKAVGESKYRSAKSHLENASENLASGKFADSIRESIHAVDAVAQILVPNSNDLGPSLTKLQKSGHIHNAMKAGFSSLYGYASDEKGIRHALIEESEPKVTETDAIYMLGACASFVTYMIGKTREFGLETA